MQPTPVPAPDLATQLGPTLQSLNEQRLGYVKQANTGLYIGAGVFVVGAVLLMIARLGPVWLLAPLVVGGAIWGGMAYAARGSYTNDFKAFVMPSLVAQFGDLRYQSSPGLSESDFNTAHLFPRPDRFKSEDLIEGAIGATRLRMSEVHAEEEHETTDSDGDRRTEYRDIFRGMMFIFDFNKSFVGQTYIMPQDITGKMGGLGKMFQKMGAKVSGRGQLVLLEDPEFAALFKVDATDQTEARYILSSSLMRRLIDLRRRQGKDVAAAFVGGQMFLMLEKNDNWFEAPPLSTPLDMNALGPTLTQLGLATGIVSDLDLNTRIWSKE